MWCATKPEKSVGVVGVNKRFPIVSKRIYYMSVNDHKMIYGKLGELCV